MNDYKEYTQDILMVFKEVIEKYNLEVKVKNKDVELIAKDFKILFLMQREGLEAYLTIKDRESERFDFFCMKRMPKADFTDFITTNDEAKQYGEFSGLRLNTIADLIWNKKLFFGFIELLLEKTHFGNVLTNLIDKKPHGIGTLPNTVITSSFEGDDYELFATGSYADLQTTSLVKTGTYAIATTSSWDYGPRLDLTNIKDGDVIKASIWGNIYPAPSGGCFILELRDVWNMRIIDSQLLNTLSTNPQTIDHWQQLSFYYTVPTTGVENLAVTLRLYTPSGTTYWDDLSAMIIRKK